MKTNARLLPFLLSALFVACALALFVLPSASAVAAPVLAQAAPVVPTAPAPVAAPFYATGEFWSALLGVVAGIVAIWRNKTAATHQRINESLVLAIEQATKLPEVAEFEQRIKQTIQAKAVQYGVQPVLHRLVQDLTEPVATDKDDALKP